MNLIEDIFDDLQESIDNGSKLSKAFEQAYNDAINVTSNNSIDNILEERCDRYGKFTTQALISQSMKNRVRGGKSWDNMDYDMKEAIDMILHKVARIVNGDPYYIDSWTDIIGYSKLVEDRLKG